MIISKFLMAKMWLITFCKESIIFCSDNEEIDEIAAIKAYNKRMEENDSASSSSSSSPSPGMFSHRMSSVVEPIRVHESVIVLENKHKEHDQQIVRYLPFHHLLYCERENFMVKSLLSYR